MATVRLGKRSCHAHTFPEPLPPLSTQTREVLPPPSPSLPESPPNWVISLCPTKLTQNSLKLHSHAKQNGISPVSTCKEHTEKTSQLLYYPQCNCLLYLPGSITQCNIVVSNPSMALNKLFRLSNLLRSTVSLTLRRNVGLSAVLFNRAKDLDPIQKLFLDKIRDYTTKSKAAPGGIVDAGASYEKGVAEEITKLQRLYGTGDLTKFPDFKFQEPQLQEVPK
ncbi:hypothetical protein UPYG_G00025690 [Umbra pygmaea]|uniref:ATP synthase peripheral stalk subunit F6, mitochondrial n=1 Tax=Umbra pygmaea TaxID=75934 RepID=A0ABD0XPU2_UMBPY